MDEEKFVDESEKAKNPDAPASEEVTEAQPVADESAEEQPASEEVTEAQPVADESADEQPASEEVTEAQPVADESADEQPASEETAGVQPAADGIPEVQPEAGINAYVQPAAQEGNIYGQQNAVPYQQPADYNQSGYDPNANGGFDPSYQQGMYGYNYGQEPVKKQKKFYQKWWFWLIVVVFVLFIIICLSDSSDSSDDVTTTTESTTYTTTTDDDDDDDYTYTHAYNYTYTTRTYTTRRSSGYGSLYVSMVKEAENSTYGRTYGEAFSNFFSSPEWEYFESTDGQDVVEFTGYCRYNGSLASIKIQFILDLSGGTFTASYLSINGVAQNRLVLSAFIQKIFETY